LLPEDRILMVYRNNTPSGKLTGGVKIAILRGEREPARQTYLPDPCTGPICIAGLVDECPVDIADLVYKLFSEQFTIQHKIVFLTLRVDPRKLGNPYKKEGIGLIKCKKHNHISAVKGQ